MKNIIKKSGQIIVFDDATMEAKLYNDGYTEDGTERIISYGGNRLPKCIAYIVIDEMSDKKIVLRNKFLRMRTNQGLFYGECWENINMYREKLDRTLTVDLENKKAVIKFARSEEILDFKNGVSRGDVYQFIRKKFMNIVSSVVIPEQDDFFKPFREFFEKSKQYSFILKLKDGEYGMPNRQEISNGFNIDKCILQDKGYHFYDATDAVDCFVSQLSTVIYMINNPGVESIVNSPYKENLYSAIFLESKTFTSVKLNEVLNVKKTSLKMMNSVSKMIAYNTSLLSGGTKCDENEIQKIISKTLYSNKEFIDKLIETMNGYNNVEYLLDCYFNNEFYLDYLAGLQQYSYHTRWNNEDGAKLQFENTIYNIASELCNIMRFVNRILNLHPDYLNNINYFSEYISKIGRKQGFQTISSGLCLLRDYIKIQKEMNANVEKYPTSISLLHDIAFNNYRFFNDNDSFKESCGNFSKAVEKYTNLDYIDNKEDFVVVHPNSFDELFVEGCSLNHCVASYIPEISAYKSKIMFIRRKDEKQTPYFTVEIKDRTINQVKGLNQVNPTDKELIKFISTWAEKKNLLENYL